MLLTHPSLPYLDSQWWESWSLITSILVLSFPTISSSSYFLKYCREKFSEEKEQNSSVTEWREKHDSHKVYKRRMTWAKGQMISGHFWWRGLKSSEKAKYHWSQPIIIDGWHLWKTVVACGHILPVTDMTYELAHVRVLTHECQLLHKRIIILHNIQGQV